MAVGHLDLIRIIEWEGEAGRGGGGETDRQTDKEKEKERRLQTSKPMTGTALWVRA